MYDVKPPKFPDSVADEYYVYSSAKVEGFTGLQAGHSSDRSSDGTVILRFDEALSKEQLKKTVDFICDNGAILLERALKSFITYYGKEELEEFCYDDGVSEIQSHNDLKHFCRIAAVHITTDYTDGDTSFALEFECDWEIEHGAGVRFKGLEVVQNGGAQVAFEESFSEYRTGSPIRDPKTGQLLSELKQK